MVVGIASKRASATIAVSGVFSPVTCCAQLARAEAEPISCSTFSSEPVLKVATAEAYRAWPDELHGAVLTAGGLGPCRNAEVKVGIETSGSSVAACVGRAVGPIPSASAPLAGKMAVGVIPNFVQVCRK